MMTDNTWIKDKSAFRAFALIGTLILLGGGLLAFSGRDGSTPPLLPILLLASSAVGLLFYAQDEPVPAESSQPTPNPPHVQWPQPATAPSFIPTSFALAPRRVVLLAASWGLTALLLYQLPRMMPLDNYTGLFIVWLMAGFAYLFALAPPGRDTPQQLRTQAQHIWTTHRIPLLILLNLILFALILRVVSIGTIPHVLGGDEGSQGLEAVRIIDGDLRNPFTTGWLGVPTMSFFFNSFTIRLFGQTNAALRLPWALIGGATVLATFFLTRRITKNTLFGFIAATFVAVYHYHIHYSRLGSNQIADPFFVTLALLFTVRALDRKKPLDWILVGMTCAVAMYFYAGARFTPIVVLAVLGYAFIRAPRRFWQDHMPGVLIMIGAFVIVGGPMIQYALRFPDDFNARINQVGIIQSGWLDREMLQTGQSAVAILFDQFRRAALVFTSYTDRTVWYGLPEPLLDPLFGAVFLVGLMFGTLKMWGGEKAQRIAPMVAWWWGGILMGGMLTESPPSSQRLITVSVPVCFFIVLALWELLGLLERGVRNLPKRALLVLLTVAFGLISLKTYFVDFTPQRIYGGHHAELATDLTPFLNEYADTHQSFFVGAPWMYWGFSTIPYMAPEMLGQDIIETMTEPPSADMILPGRGAIFIFLPERSQELGLVRQAFSNGQIRELRATATDNRIMAVLYFVPPN